MKSWLTLLVLVITFAVLSCSSPNAADNSPATLGKSKDSPVVEEDPPEPLAPIKLDSAAEADAEAWVRSREGRVTRDNAQPGRPVIRVDLAFASIIDEDLKQLRPFAALESLSLIQTATSDAGLEHLSQFARLHTLRVGKGVTDKGLTTLAKFQALRNLDLGGASVTNDGLANLATHPKLRSLLLSVNALTDDCCTSLAKIKSLRELDLRGTKVLGPKLGELAALTELRSLSLAHCSGKIPDIAQLDFSKLKSCSKLAKVDLEFAIIADGYLAQLAEVGSLRELNLKWTRITDIGLASLRPLVNLKSLELMGTQLTSECVETLATFKHLETLDLGGLPIGTAQVRRLLSLEKIRSVSLMNTRISDSAIEQLSKWKELKELNLSGTRISTDGVEALAGLEKLEKLNLRETSTRSEPLQKLTGLKHLRKLDLFGTAIDDPGFKFLGKMERLEELYLGGDEVWRATYGAKITDAGVSELGGLRKLRILSLRDTDATNECIEVLKKLTSLESLDITSSRITETGLEPLRIALPKCDIGFRAKP